MFIYTAHTHTPATSLPFSSGKCLSQDVGGVEVVQGLLDTSNHGLLTLTDPDTGVVLLLVGLVSTLGVTDLRLQVLNVVDHVVADTAGVGPLQVSVQVDLDDTVGDGGVELLNRGAGTTVEDEEDYFIKWLAGVALAEKALCKRTYRASSAHHPACWRQTPGACPAARGAA